MKWPSYEKINDVIAEAIDNEEIAIVVPLSVALEMMRAANSHEAKVAMEAYKRCQRIDKINLTANEIEEMVRGYIAAHDSNDPLTMNKAAELYGALARTVIGTTILAVLLRRQ